MHQKQSSQSITLESQYLAFSRENHAEGSNTAPSYVAALKKIDTALHLHGVFLAPNESVWEIRDVVRLAALYEFIKGEQKKMMEVFFAMNHPKVIGKRDSVLLRLKIFHNF